MTFDKYLADQRGWLAARYFWSRNEGWPRVDSHSSTAGLSDDQVSEFKRSLVELMPIDSTIVDLWDWDVRFENDLEDEWFLYAAFGGDDTLEFASEELAEFFLEQADKLDLDYDQSSAHDISEWIGEEAKQFVVAWRTAITEHFDPLQLGASGVPVQAQSKPAVSPQLRALEHVAFVIECIAQQCIGDGKFEWDSLAKRLDRGGEYDFPGSDSYAKRLDGALRQFLASDRAAAVNELARVSRALWKEEMLSIEAKGP